MTRTWLIGLSTATVFVLALTVVAAACWFSPEQYDALGSLFGAAASFLAVIWFSGSLYCQSIQLKEQREQFSLELKEQREQFAVQFRQLREDARRNALTLAKDILREAEDAALKANPLLQSINELPTAFLNSFSPLKISPLKILMESTDPIEVRDSAADWFKIGSAVIFDARHKKLQRSCIFQPLVGQTSITPWMRLPSFSFTVPPFGSSHTLQSIPQ